MLQKEKEQEKQPNVKEVLLNVDSDPYGIFMFAMNSQVTKQGLLPDIVSWESMISLNSLMLYYSV